MNLPSDEASSPPDPSRAEVGSSLMARFLRWLEREFPQVFFGFRNVIAEVRSTPTKTTADVAREILLSSESPKADRHERTPQKSAPEGESAPPQAEVFLKQMRDQTERRDNELDREAASLRLMSHSLLKVELSLAMVTFGVAVCGVWLAIGGRAALGVVSGGIGLLTGGGTVILNRMVKELRHRRDVNGKIREDNIRTLQAIQGALLVTDRKERDAEIRKLAAWLRDRAMREPA
jgi:hypothetical protein